MVVIAEYPRVGKPGTRRRRGGILLAKGQRKI